jgi:hypothetical protein
MPIKIKKHENFEPNMPKVPITQSRALWAPPQLPQQKTTSKNPQQKIPSTSNKKAPSMG